MACAHERGNMENDIDRAPISRHSTLSLLFPLHTALVRQDDASAAVLVLATVAGSGGTQCHQTVLR